MEQFIPRVLHIICPIYTTQTTQMWYVYIYIYEYNTGTQNPSALRAGRLRRYYNNINVRCTPIHTRAHVVLALINLKKSIRRQCGSFVRTNDICEKPPDRA